MMFNRTVAVGALAVFALGGVGPTHADPCGMVPPMQIIGNAVPIERVGAQKTFVFHKDGVETMVLRPGFKGKVDNFGMLIPFPSAPAIRKVDDNIFPHIAAAIDPPEIVAYVRRYRARPSSRSSRGAKVATTADASGAPGLGYNQVKVLRQEAVGMYEVAVLAAGSARALKRWVDSHGYKYPKGMDGVVNDYVRSRWVFVAIKTKVGQKGGVNPRPGMRSTNSKLPAGATFSGHVQAMGFRFKSRRLVVPMRLSAFNKGKLRNVVYVLTDGPRRITEIPRRFVVRQISGKQLYRNVTGPLPLRVIGGTYKQLSQSQRNRLTQRRRPAPYNGLAKQLFAADLLAVARNRLANPDEEREKRLLAIGERLGLRGKEIDALHAKVLSKSRGKAQVAALETLKRMTMTIIDGDFDRDTIAKQNLTFGRYRMARHRNNRRSYDARVLGPGTVNRGGKVYHGALLPSTAPASPGVGVRLASAEQEQVMVARSLESGLENFKTAPAVLAKLIRRGPRGVDDILDYIADSQHLEGRGWAIVALADISGAKARRGLGKIHTNTALPMLVRTWAAAARVRVTRKPAALQSLTSLMYQFPAVKRPLGKRIAQLLARDKSKDAAENLLVAVSRMPQLRGQLQGAIMALGPRKLVRAMTRSKKQQARRMAASYLATMAAKPNSRVARAVVRAYRFRRRASQVPWAGGPLFVPALRWTQAQARALVGNLIRWHLWADLKGKRAIQRQLHNNLRSLQLARAAGYRSPGWNSNTSTKVWLRTWRQVVGERGIRKILREQRAQRNPLYGTAVRVR